MLKVTNCAFRFLSKMVDSESTDSNLVAEADRYEKMLAQMEEE